MNIAIVYATRYGSTAYCAELLKSKLGGVVAVFDIAKDKVDLTQYDSVIIGSPVRIGRIDSKIKRFINRNKAELLKKRIGLYFCSMTAPYRSEYFDPLYDADIKKSAVCTYSFGGKLPDQPKGVFDKFIINAVKSNEDMKSSMSQNGLLMENIDLFVQDFTK